jgi:hypothetical protein
MLAEIDRKTEYLRAVVIGLFETRTPLSKLVIVNGAWPNGMRGGFGTSGDAPAQILLKSLSDLRIEKKPTDHVK